MYIDKGPAVAPSRYKWLNNCGHILLAGPAVRFIEMKTIRDLINIVEDTVDERVTIGADGRPTPSFADHVRMNAEKKQNTSDIAQAEPKVQGEDDRDLGDGFVATTVEIMGEKLPAVLDTQSQVYILLNRRASGGAIIRTMAPYITKKGEEVTTAATVGPATKAALKRAGLE